ncbi:MAG TPA: GntR family transcriptional regulator [Longimicrobiales bacterium]|nr:GntR family transcriptional regulator [Longimicrobiales bacterium]
MAREQAAGSVVVDRLRERIVSGVYLGSWHAGERLPSIRAIAESENVDRKTVAAAYRRLETEGLVRVHARSGVYLRGNRFPDAPGPLERLHRRWLETTYERAGALGLDSRTILRLITAVAEVERQAVPVVECDSAQSESIAGELRQRLGLNTLPFTLHSEVDDAAVAYAPFIITTPFHRTEVGQIWPDRPIVEVTLSLETVRELRTRLDQGPLAIIVATETIASKLRKAVQRGQLTSQTTAISVVVAQTPAHVQTQTNGYRTIFVWPGTPQWVRDCLNRADCVTPVYCLSDDSIGRVRSAVLDAAIRRAHEPGRPEEFTTTNGGEAQLTAVSVA